MKNLAIATILLAAAFPGSAETVLVNQRFPFQTQIVNSCIDQPETVYIDGEYHILVQQIYSGDKHKYVTRITAHGKGTTDSGKEYIWNDTNHLVETYQDPPPTLQVRRLDYLRLVGKGRTPNLFVRWQLRWFTDFVNPPVEEQRYDVECH